MNKYTEAIQGDDVVILCDGIPMGVGEILAALNAATPPADAPTIREINEREDYQREHGEYPPADALADALETASNRCHGQDVAALRKAAAALRARQQAVPQHINAVYFDVPAQPRSAYVMGWNDCIDSMLAASQSATGGAK